MIKTTEDLVRVLNELSELFVHRGKVDIVISEDDFHLVQRYVETKPLLVNVDIKATLPKSLIFYSPFSTIAFLSEKYYSVNYKKDPIEIYIDNKVRRLREQILSDDT